MAIKLGCQHYPQEFSFFAFNHLANTMAKYWNPHSYQHSNRPHQLAHSCIWGLDDLFFHDRQPAKEEGLTMNGLPFLQKERRTIRSCGLAPLTSLLLEGDCKQDKSYCAQGSSKPHDENQPFLGTTKAFLQQKWNKWPGTAETETLSLSRKTKAYLHRNEIAEGHVSWGITEVENPISFAGHQAGDSKGA